MVCCVRSEKAGFLASLLWTSAPSAPLFWEASCAQHSPVAVSNHFRVQTCCTRSSSWVGDWGSTPKLNTGLGLRRFLESWSEFGLQNKCTMEGLWSLLEDQAAGICVNVPAASIGAFVNHRLLGSWDKQCRRSMHKHQVVQGPLPCSDSALPHSNSCGR